MLALEFVVGLLAACASGTPRTWSLPPEVQVIRVNGYEMAYVERGQGVPLILVHGTMGDYRNWESLITQFSDHYRTISVSLRHAYPEAWNGEGNDAALTQHASDLVAFVQALGAAPYTSWVIHAVARWFCSWPPRIRSLRVPSS
ncbi:hypothetical protein AU476_10410 [Cupriavidus sp. UYMSc13B]|nr:hypothetical protein AU476_10410 [Cupriavidus sp. UYMSc13B]